MEAIKNWFENSKDYYEGVTIYASLPNRKHRLLKRLNRGKSNQNMAALVAELRKYKAKPLIKKTVTPTIHLPVYPTQEQVTIEMEQKKIASESAKAAFGGIRMGDLPPELRIRFIKAQKVFHEMIELKFVLNDLPDSASESALKIQLQILELDEERDLIWKELHHWKKHRTLLDVPKDDFSDLTPVQLLRKKNNLKSSISKISKRVDEKYIALDAERDKHKQLLLEGAIRKSENLLHSHQLNLNKIDALL